MLGSLARKSSEANSFFVLLLSVTAWRDTGVPIRSASLSVGSDCRSATAAGVSRRERSAKSTRNGRWTWKLAIAVSSVGGPFEIVSCRHDGQWPIAANVFAISVNTTAFVCATGAT